eukprot:COSAG02_NODE_1870_length_10588_cov_78.982652_5_plen_71_part_00
MKQLTPYMFIHATYFYRMTSVHSNIFLPGCHCVPFYWYMYVSIRPCLEAVQHITACSTHVSDTTHWHAVV